MAFLVDLGPAREREGRLSVVIGGSHPGRVGLTDHV
jgi:hypothetical protein